MRNRAIKLVKQNNPYALLWDSYPFKTVRDKVDTKIQQIEREALTDLADRNDIEAKEKAAKAKNWRECMSYIKTIILNSTE